MAKSRKIIMKPKACTRHSFSLKAVSPHQHHPLHLQASFCQPHTSPQSPPNPAPAPPNCLNCPALNLDRLPSTPTFVLALEAKQRLGDSLPLRYEYQNQWMQKQCEKSELNVPKPRSKNNYCSICRCTFEDYLSHIHKKSHREAIRRNPFNQHILDLARDCRRRRGRERGRGKEAVEVTEVDDDSVEIVENPERKHGGEQGGMTRWGWHEYSTTDYPKEFMAIFRGMNEYGNYNCMLNPFGLPPFLPLSFSLPALPPAPLFLPPLPPKRPRELTYIIIDE